MSTTEQQQKLAELLKNASLSNEARMTFGSHLALLTEENLSRVLSAVESDPEELSRLYDNFKKKRAALESDDASAWDNVIKEEEERLQSIEAS